MDMDFNTSTKYNPDSNTTDVMVEFPATGKIYTTSIKHRDYPDETQALINGTIYKLVYKVYTEHMRNIIREQIRAKLEEKSIEIIKMGRPKSTTSKHNLTEEQKQYEREKSLRHYYKNKQITVR